jgi:hypothetical protein
MIYPNAATMLEDLREAAGVPDYELDQMDPDAQWSHIVAIVSDLREYKNAFEFVITRMAVR